MSKKKEELKEIILEYISENIDPNDTEMVKKFEKLLKELELQNI